MTMHTPLHTPRPAAPGTRRRLLRDGLFVALGMALTLSLSASAEWKVQDGKLRQVGGSDYREGRDGEAQGKFKAPEVAFASKNITIDEAPQPKGLPGTSGLKISGVEMPIDTRCARPSPPTDGLANDLKNTLRDKLKENLTGGAQSIADQQFQVCREIVETQQVRFKYNVVMSELAEKRYERLRQLREQRRSLRNDEAGKLQENSNRMLALIAAVQIDQQQRAAYNDVYEARLVYLEGVQQRLSQRTLDGKPNVVAELATMGVLAASLGIKPERVLPKL